MHMHFRGGALKQVHNVASSRGRHLSFWYVHVKQQLMATSPLQQETRMAREKGII